MSALKRISRFLLAICMILLLVQIILTAVAIFTVGTEKVEAFSYLVVRLTSSVLFMVLAVFGFKKLGNSKPVGPI